MNDNRIKFAAILSGLLFLVMLSLIIFMHPVDKVTEMNTTELSAVVSSIEVTNTGENVFIKIYVDEYDQPLYISTAVSKQIHIGSVEQFKKGQIIYFRIENSMLKQFQEADFGNIVSLKVSDKEIFSLIQYNQCIHDAALPARLISIAFLLVVLLINILCILKLTARRQ